MIATHNVKVNGRWYHAGEEISEPKATVEAVEQLSIPEAEGLKAEETPNEEPKSEPKRATTRRKASK